MREKICFTEAGKICENLENFKNLFSEINERIRKKIRKREKNYLQDPDLPCLTSESIFRRVVIQTV